MVMRVVTPERGCHWRALQPWSGMAECTDKCTPRHDERHYFAHELPKAYALIEPADPMVGFGWRSVVATLFGWRSVVATLWVAAYLVLYAISHAR